MTSFDYIAEARAIRDALGEDQADWKARIDGVIAEGSTGTEILMGLRWNFAELLKVAPPLPPKTIERIKDFIIAANRLLS